MNENQAENTPNSDEAREVTTENGEAIQLQINPDSMREVGAGNFEIDETVQINGHNVKILGVASMFAGTEYRVGDPNNMLWVQIEGEETAMYLRLKPDETYDSLLGSN